MKTEEFFNTLKVHKDKSLLFEYAPNLLVGANYHITEVKHTTIDSVDCGAQTETWKETVVQLWESPSELGKTEYMSCYKALGILNKVGKMKPYSLDAEIKFEYSNVNFHTAQLFVNDFEIRANNVILKLVIKKTDCKAKDICGVPEVEIVENISNNTSSCTPGSGCC